MGVLLLYYSVWYLKFLVLKSVETSLSSSIVRLLTSCL